MKWSRIILLVTGQVAEQIGGIRNNRSTEIEVEYRLARLCVFLCTRLPLRLCYTLAEAMANALYTFCPGLRDDAESSAADVLGQTKGSSEVSRAARRCMANYAKDVIGLCRYGGRPAEAEARVSFEGLDRLDAALSEGKGVIIVGLHLGSWDVGAVYLSQRHYPLNAIVLSSNGNDRLDTFMRHLRCEAGIRVISAHGGLGPAAEALRRNEVLAMLIDAATEGKSVKVRFLGGYAQFSPGAAVLALRTKAAVLPMCTVRLPDNTFKGFIGERVESGLSGDLQSSIQSLTQRILDSLQGFVQQYPDQWGMMPKMESE
jgi:lauroyl/myristoyl acyltransferase